MHSAHGVRCVLRIGHCAELATPTEAARAEAAMASAGTTPTVVHVDLSAHDGASPIGAAAVDALLATAAAPAAAPLVLVRLTLPPLSSLPPSAQDGATSREHQRLLDHLAGHPRGGGRAVAARGVRLDPRLRDTLRAFRRRCVDLSSGPNCNNICS